MTTFMTCFEALTGFQPLKWQCRLFELLKHGDIPRHLTLPTGLGKTSVIPIWLIALVHHLRANGSPLPRRLVYIVNRRTVVDQATDLVVQMRERLLRPEDPRWRDHAPVLQQLATALKGLAGENSDVPPLAVSTLRGELADNAEWKTNPARPAIVIGTIDMIGSKLLFSGYGDGRYGRAHHAGLIGHDALIVHDEAHLTPAFSGLLRAVEKEQSSESRADARPIRVMELSATARHDAANTTPRDASFGIEPEDQDDPVAQRRIHAQKRLSLVEVQGDEKSVADAIARRALEYRDNRCRVLVYVRSPKDADKVAHEIQKHLDNGADERVALLTGTIRGYDRDHLARSALFRAFTAGSNAPCDRTLYLVSTSAGEVGVDFDADHLLCDLTTLDSMIQRFGRVNRLGVDSDGNPRNATITVFVPKERKSGKSSASKLLATAIAKTGEILQRIFETGGDASPAALANTLGKLSKTDLRAAFSPEAKTRDLSDILFDAWSLTSVDDDLPTRPEVEQYLHGITEGEPPETFVAWRAEVKDLADANVDETTLRDWFEACPILAHERLRDTTKCVLEQLRKLLKTARKKNKDPDFDLPVVLLNERGQAEIEKLSRLTEKSKGRHPLAYATLVLPVEAGGLSEKGMFDANADPPHPEMDVAEKVPGGDGAAGAPPCRQRWLFVRDEDGERYEKLPNGERHAQPPPNLRERMRITLRAPEESDEEGGPVRELILYVEPRATTDSPEFARFRETLADHAARVAEHTRRISEALNLPEPFRHVLVLAARWHDAGKDRSIWQQYASNENMGEPLAKSERYLGGRFLGGYRHEFGSLLDVRNEPDFQALDKETQDLVLHLIAAHHGWARPHFEPDAQDNEGPMDRASRQRLRPTTAENENTIIETVQRFGRLQKRLGRWHLAWLESLLRCADALASHPPATTGNGDHREANQ